MQSRCPPSTSTVPPPPADTLHGLPAASATWPLADQRSVGALRNVPHVRLNNRPGRRQRVGPGVLGVRGARLDPLDGRPIPSTPRCRPDQRPLENSAEGRFRVNLMASSSERPSARIRALSSCIAAASRSRFFRSNRARQSRSWVRSAEPYTFAATPPITRYATWCRERVATIRLGSKGGSWVTDSGRSTSNRDAGAGVRLRTRE